MPHRVCAEAGCASFATYRGRCQDHSRQRERQIDRAGKKVYNSKRWTILRRHKLSHDPLCERCQKELANTVHHKQDIAEGGEQFAISNLESCCASCHSKLTRAGQIKPKRPSPMAMETQGGSRG